MERSSKLFEKVDQGTIETYDFCLHRVSWLLIKGFKD